MDFEYLINTYGYLAVLIGTFIEGESVLILGGMASQMGYLELPGVIGSAFAASLAWDQTLFFTGRRYGRAGLARFPRIKPKVDRVLGLIDRYRAPVIFIFPFLHGIRGVSPLAIGMSGVPVKLFVCLNIAATVLWAASLGLGGYFFGQAAQSFLGDMKYYQIGALAGLVCVALLVWVVKRCWSRKRGAEAD